MTEIRTNKTTAIWVAALVAVAVVATYFGVRYSMLHVRTALAQEQMTVFADMRDRALKADPKEAVGYLRYAVDYYPSGTKQIPGSPLDLMVEQCRSEMIGQMVADLREKTGRDLGPVPGKWIAEYGAD